MATIIDSHCHVFNGSILRDLLHPAMDTPQGVKPGTKMGSWWGYMKEVASVLVNSQNTNNDFIINALKKEFPTYSTYATIPLMMDINYMHNDMLNINENIVASSIVAFETNIQNQISGLQELSKNGNCYPFFCIDPRRPGVIESILDGNFITRKPGGFYGIKLYPRLGYHPMAGRLPLLYQYCAKNNIPITTHCSLSGFPPWHTDAEDFCDPENFRPALEANPNLTIDFAHFGNKSISWGNTIIDLMETYPNVYSDLACYTGNKDIDGFKHLYWGKNADNIVKQRTMYGSDFDVFYFTKAEMDMHEYMHAFKASFTKEELHNMMSVLPPKFLGICI